MLYREGHPSQTNIHVPMHRECCQEYDWMQREGGKSNSPGKPITVRDMNAISRILDRKALKERHVNLWPKQRSPEFVAGSFL